MDAEQDSSPRASGGTSSPSTVLSRLQTRFQQAAEDISLAKAQNAELEKRIGVLTETILTANEEKEAIKAEHRAEVRRLEEAALSERRRYEDALCAARQQQQRCQMDRDLATDELAALRSQVKQLQMEKVSMARQVRDLEAEVKARCRLQQNAAEQMIRHSAAKQKLNKEMSALSEWLQRLQAEAGAATELNRRLSLQLQHQNLRLQQLNVPAAHAAAADATCPELEELRALMGASAAGGGGGRAVEGAGDAGPHSDGHGLTGGPQMQGKPPSGEESAHVRPDRIMGTTLQVATLFNDAGTEASSNGHQAAVEVELAVGSDTNRTNDSVAPREGLLLTMPQLPRINPDGGQL